ncbi:MAG TPA: hypothetical protein VGD76_00935 [Ramlibacter sp.]
MPHPKNGLKLTGDTHLHDPRLDLYLEDDEPIEAVVVEDIRVYADGYERPAAAEMDHPEPPTKLQKVERTVARQTARTPLLMMGAGLLFGWMVMRVLRR